MAWEQRIYSLSRKQPELGENGREVAVAVTSEKGYEHAFLFYRSRNGEPGILHLKSHCQVESTSQLDLFATGLWSFPVLPMGFDKLVAAEADRVAETYRKASVRLAGPPITEETGPRFSIAFDHQGLEAYLTDRERGPISGRVNCGSFVLILFEKVRTPLLRREEWEPRPDDPVYFDKYKSVVKTAVNSLNVPSNLRQRELAALDEQLDKERDLPIVRIADLAAAAAHEESTPLSFTLAESRRQTLEAELARECEEA